MCGVNGDFKVWEDKKEWLQRMLILYSNTNSTCNPKIISILYSKSPQVSF